jgi:hypothetical protein
VLTATVGVMLVIQAGQADGDRLACLDANFALIKEAL